MVIACCLFGACLAKAGSQPGTVVAWGNTNYGQASVPLGLSNVVAIAAGDWHSLALQSNCTVVAWGNNDSGQTNVPVGLSNVVAIAAGSDHSLALSNGIVVAWGYNYFGQATVPAGLSNVLAIAGGGSHSLALRSNGTVVAWGRNNSSQTNVPPGLTNVVAIAAGANHSLALSKGTVVAWGDNYYGQTNVPPGLTNVVAIAAGANHSLAISNGTVVAWGWCFNGEAYVPVTVPAGLSNVVAIAAGGGHSLALQSNGRVWDWGTYYSGSGYVPMTAPAGLSNVVAIAGGHHHSMAISLGAGPTIVSSPPSAASLASGAATNLSVVVSSVSPYGCQWSLNGVPMKGETGTSLVITNFDLAKAGSYSVLVTNQGGSATTGSVVRLASSPVVRVDGVDVGGGTVTRVDSSVQITMSSAFGPDADIYYTLDGSDPGFGVNYTLYSGAFTVATNVTIRAIAFNLDYMDEAEAAPIYVQIWPTYALLAGTPGGGSVSVSPAPYSGTNRYVSNTVVTNTATPSIGWSFIDWTGDSTATTAVTTLIMNRDRAVQAIFGTSLSLSTNGNGQISLNPANGPYPYGSTVQLTALPATNYYFFAWAGAASGFSDPLSIQATNASGITALFAPLLGNQVSLTVLPLPSGSNGTVTVSPFKSVYTNGETVKLTALPAANNVFTGWSGRSGTTNPLTLVLHASKLIYANFALGTAPNPPVITSSPLSRTLSVGESTTLSVRVTGDLAFSYQWRFNSSPISGATNSTLTLTNFTATNAGLYSVIVSNPAGATTSSNASVALFGLGKARFGSLTFPLLILDGAVGTSYRLEYDDHLVPTNWMLLDTVTLEEAEGYWVDDPVANHSRRFYRAVPQ